MHKVLLAFGDLDLAILLASALKVHDITVAQAQLGADAYRIATEEGAEVVIVDDILPDELGTSLIARLRHAGVKCTVVFYSTAMCSPQILEHFEDELGVSLVIYKQTTPMVFARKIAELIEKGTVDDDGQKIPSRKPPVEFIELEQTFALRLPSKLDELGKAIDQAQKDPEVIHVARELAHRLRGTTAPYGYQDVSDLIGGVEDLLEPLVNGRAARPSFLWNSIKRALRDAGRCAQRGPDSIASIPSEKLPLTQRPTLLVVDSDVDVLRDIRAFSSRHSVQVITAQSMDEALDKVEGVPLNAALLGIEGTLDSARRAIEALRTAPGNRRLPVVVASKNVSLSARVAAVTAGATRFLDKPISEQSFSEFLQQAPFTEPQATRIVAVDDDEIVLEKLECDLRDSGYYVRSVVDPNGLLETLEDVRPDVLLLDINLGSFSGIDICRALRSSEMWQFLPILLFSSDGRSELRVRAYQAGASDVLTKPLTAHELMTRVSAHAERIRSIRERSDRDALSGLMLRRTFVETLQRSLATSARDGKPVAIILFDLDHFKQINDRYGHLMGDRVIAAFGNLLRRRFRLEDLRGRWGGEEFVLAFPGQAMEFARKAAERLLEEFSAKPFETDDGTRFHASFTAGVAVFPFDGESLDVLIKRADDLLYRGKSLGRAQVCTTQTEEEKR